MAKSQKLKIPERQNACADNTENQIRCRAYELYEARGREDGREVEDWLQAEQEIHGTAQALAAAK